MCKMWLEDVGCPELEKCCDECHSGWHCGAVIRQIKHTPYIVCCSVGTICLKKWAEVTKIWDEIDTMNSCNYGPACGSGGCDQCKC